jgi:hypothetical protein
MDDRACRPDQDFDQRDRERSHSEMRWYAHVWRGCACARSTLQLTIDSIGRR